MIFFPEEGEITGVSLKEKSEKLMESAQRYKAAIFEIAPSAVENPVKREATPGEMRYAFNWAELASLLKQVRDLSEINPANKAVKAEHLTKLAEIYEVLRGAKMPKLEAVRMALMNEVNHLLGK